MIVKSPYPDVEIPEVSVAEFVLSAFDRFPDKPAFIDGPSGATTTYQALGERIRAFAAGLQSWGLAKGDVVGIFSPNFPDYAVVFHGVALAGGIVTTANPLYTARELREQLADAGAKMLVCHAAFLDIATDAMGGTGVRELFVIGESEGARTIDDLIADTADLQPVEIDARRDVVVLPYSSGTTGLPKGVMLTHHNLVSNLCQLAGVNDVDLITDTDTILGVLPFFHIYGMLVIMNYGLHAGASIVTMPRFDLEGFLSLIQDHRVTRVNVVPPIVVALGKHPMVDDFDLSSLLSVFSGAAPLGEDLANEVRTRLGCDILQGYGLTETSPVTHCSPSNPEVRSSIGAPIPNTEVRIVDVDSGESLGPGESGELYIKGPQVMLGYLNNPDATAETIVDDGWLRTGDLGYYDEESRFFIVDRVKELIKYNAYQVAPAELEGLLLGHPAVADVAVIPVSDERTGQIPKAYVVKKNDVSDRELMDWLAERVAPQKRVRLIEFTDVIPKSASGKILRRELIERERERAAGVAAASD
ncbi:MAG: AMP-binding protein [Thermomicrobiales bacterium]